MAKSNYSITVTLSRQQCQAILNGLYALEKEPMRYLPLQHGIVLKPRQKAAESAYTKLVKLMNQKEKYNGLPKA